MHTSIRCSKSAFRFWVLTTLHFAKWKILGYWWRVTFGNPLNGLKRLHVLIGYRPIWSFCSCLPCFLCFTDRFCGSVYSVTFIDLFSCIAVNLFNKLTYLSLSPFSFKRTFIRIVNYTTRKSLAAAAATDNPQTRPGQQKRCSDRRQHCVDVESIHMNSGLFVRWLR